MGAFDSWLTESLEVYGSSLTSQAEPTAAHCRCEVGAVLVVKQEEFRAVGTASLRHIACRGGCRPRAPQEPRSPPQSRTWLTW